jgi:integrase
MPTVTLSRKVVSALPAKSSAYIAYDNRLPGFGCRVTPTGAKSWIVEYRPHGGGRRVAKKRVTLGHISTVPPEAARRSAAEILARVQLGDDVAEERATLRKAPTVAELVEKYMADEIRPTRKRSTSAHYEMLFRKHIVPEFGNVRACALVPSQVARFHRAVGADRPVTANRLVTLISGLYSWATKAGEVPENVRPARGITRFREEGRERFLLVEELARLGDALREAETIGIPWGVDETKPKAKHAPKLENRRCIVSPFATAAIRLLLLTGCRLREILHLRWDYVDFERGMLFLPDSKTGRKPVMLSSAALSLLDGIPRVGKYVIVGANLEMPRHDWGRYHLRCTTQRRTRLKERKYR